MRSSRNKREYVKPGKRAPAESWRKFNMVRSIVFLTQASANRGIAPLALSEARLTQLPLLSTLLCSLAMLVLVSTVCFALYGCTVNLGFLHDDLLHFDQAWRALHADPGDFLNNFWGNWGRSDLMRSYRPIISLSFLGDCILWQNTPSGFHVTNVLIFAITCLLVSCLAKELAGRIGYHHTWPVAAAAAMLFACYPLHPESVAWIVGRVDLICTLFYLGSLLLFFKYEQHRQKRLLYAAVFSFLLALASKEMAVTLPLVITLAAFLPQPAAATERRSFASNLHDVAPFWLALFSFAIMRTFFLGTIIGGYGGSSWRTTMRALVNLVDRTSMLKTLYPVNEEFHCLSAIATLLNPVYLVIAMLGIAKFKHGNFGITTAFLAIWAIVAVLPTFEVWHIYPNLIGGRLFYLSSVPLCVLIALAIWPQSTVRSIRQRLSATTAILALAYICSGWCWLLQENLGAWTEAGRRMSVLISQLQALANSTPDNARVLLLELPTDYKGAAMLTRSQYLHVLSRPPFISRDITKQLVAVDAWCNPAISSEVQTSQFWQVLRWDTEAGRFVR